MGRDRMPASAWVALPERTPCPRGDLEEGPVVPEGACGQEAEAARSLLGNCADRGFTAGGRKRSGCRLKAFGRVPCLASDLRKGRGQG